MAARVAAATTRVASPILLIAPSRITDASTLDADVSV
jgi:hypothetical protein